MIIIRNVIKLSNLLYRVMEEYELVLFAFLNNKESWKDAIDHKAIISVVGIVRWA